MQNIFQSPIMAAVAISEHMLGNSLKYGLADRMIHIMTQNRTYYTIPLPLLSMPKNEVTVCKR